VFARPVPPEEVCTDPLLLSLRTLDEGAVLLEQTVPFAKGSATAAVVFESLDEVSCDDWTAHFDIPWIVVVTTSVDEWSIDGESSAVITSVDGQLSTAASGGMEESGSAAGEYMTLDYTLSTTWMLNVSLDEDLNWTEAELVADLQLDGEGDVHAKAGWVSSTVSLDAELYATATPGTDDLPHGVAEISADYAWDVEGEIQTKNKKRNIDRSGSNSVAKEFAF
jgi:hypothetical protein